MSGPIVPPLEVTEVDGSPDGRPITKIVVSNGDLTFSGRTATIDTTGSGGTPAGSDREIQFNDAGAFGASSQFKYQTGANLGRLEMTTGASATKAEIRGLDGHGLTLASSDVAASAVRSSIDLFGENDAPSGVLVSSEATGGIITLKHTGAGYTEIANHTTDSDTTLNVYGNGAGTPILNLKNDTKEVRLTCEDDDKLYVRGPTSGERFTFDASSATGGITWPDGTEQITAASGGVSTLAGLTDVSMDITNFVDSLLIQTDSDGAAPTTGTLSSASNNIGIGAGTFGALTSGYHSVCIGNLSGDSLTTGYFNTFVGYKAGSNLQTGFSNTIIGNQEYRSGVLMTGSLNTIVGQRAGEDVTSGNYNLLLGYASGQNVTSGESNCAIGPSSLWKTTTNSYSVALGKNAGYRQNSAKNIFIGYKAGAQDGTSGSGASNIVIGVESVHVAPGAGVGNVAIGQGEHTVAEGDDQLLISSGAGAVNWIRGDDAGACYQGDNASTWSTTSDQRLKREIVDATVGLDAINAVQVRNFRYIEKAEPIIETDTDEDGEEYEHIVGYDGENRYDLDPEPVRVGVIAQELQEVLPDAVKENAHGHLIVNPDSINWALLRAVQELSAKVEALEAA